MKWLRRRRWPDRARRTVFALPVGEGVAGGMPDGGMTQPVGRQGGTRRRYSVLPCRLQGMGEGGLRDERNRTSRCRKEAGRLNGAEAPGEGKGIQRG